MIIIPAIDIYKGMCVRLTQGDYSCVKTYTRNPTSKAMEFKNAGASCLHIIDLQGAQMGRPINKKLIVNMSKKIGLPVQIGGGIRTFRDAKELFNSGVDKVIIGTPAIEKSDLVRKIIRNYSAERMIIAVDVKNNVLMSRGWQKTNNIPLNKFLNILRQMGVIYVLVTDIKKDGTLTKPNFELMSSIVKYGFQVIAAGGISSIDDLKKLEKCGVYGAVLGKVLYEEKLNLEKILPIFSPNNLTKRIIPCLDVKDGKVVKGVHFTRLINAGYAMKLAQLYSKNGADELVFLDITATFEKRKTLQELVEKIAKNIHIPFTVGGGITNINDVRCLLNAGADKVSLGTAAVLNPNLVKKISQKYGSQCLVISIDAKKSGTTWVIYIRGGKQKTSMNAITFAKKMEKLGAGELLINSLDRDGTKKGFDIELLNKISQSVNIPVIASSGAGTKKDFLDVLKQTSVDAVLAATVFHYGKIKIKKLKQYLKNNNVPVRL